jgi:hypothetical protein
MKQSLQPIDVENFDDKWSKMYGILKAYWKHPRGSRYARWLGVPKEDCDQRVLGVPPRVLNRKRKHC